jgi:hypothetical protein
MANELNPVSRVAEGPRPEKLRLEVQNLKKCPLEMHLFKYRTLQTGANE